MSNLADVRGLRNDELLRSQTRHAAILRSLFHTTIFILEFNHAKHPNADLGSFLEANSIVNGHCFQVSTLPSIGGINARPVESYLGPYEPNKESKLEPRQQNEATQGGKHGRSGPAAPNGDSRQAWSNEPSKWLEEGSQSASISAHDISGVSGQDNGSAQPLGSLVEAIDSETDGNARQEPSLRPSQALPLSSDDAGTMSPPYLQNSVAEQRPKTARTVHLPPKEIQEKRVDHPDPEKSDGEEQGKSPAAINHKNYSSFSSQASAEGAGINPSNERTPIKYQEPTTNDILKPQMEIARAEIFSGAPTTPNEQLHIEEAQSMQLSHRMADKDSQSMQPPGSLSSQFSSQFTHGNMEDADESSMPELAILQHDVSISESGAVQGATSEQSSHVARTTSGLRDHIFHGMNAESSRDVTLSRRPPMRIDTGVPSTSAVPDSKPAANMANSHTPSGSATPNKVVHPATNAQSPPERMTTRVSSGALRHKSVSEILGETPKATPIQADKGNFDRGLSESHREDHGSLQTPRSTSSFTSPDPATFRQRLSELRDKERSKLSTVVFASSRNPESSQTQRSDDKEAPAEDKDYFLTLFAAKASSPLATNLNHLLKTAHKTLTTSDLYTDLKERQACQVLTRIHDLQKEHKWSLRQLERSAEPDRRVAHWDVLLGQMRWMRTDFREERKWKIAASKFTADACADWVASSPEERTLLQVQVRPVRTRAKSRSLSASTPDLVHSADDEASEATDDDSIRVKSTSANAPAAIFSLPPEMYIFGLNKSPVAEKLLHELPLYRPNTDVQNAALGITECVPDAAWKKPLVPVSKYAQGKIVLAEEEEPPRKRSRFSHLDEESSQSRNVNGLSSGHLEHAISPKQEDVALFDPENKHIRDRIHAGHAFRPPSEYVMPSQSFFESRQSSQWTPEEDHELRKLVRDYAYNWSLISSCLASPSMFQSQAERRTPWECFERWISLEGLPVEMAKINYFRAYHSRLQAAQRTVDAQHQTMQQAHGNNPGQIPVRRRTTQPYAVDRRKNQRHLHLIDAMRKLARKKETAVHKQQHIASLAAMRKGNETVKQRPLMHTPQEFSRLKHERQLKLEEQQRQYRAQMLQHQKAAQAAKANQQVSQPANGVPPVRNPVAGLPNGGSPNMTAANVHGQIRGGGGDPARPTQMQRLMNGQANGILPTNSHGVPHAPMQPNLQTQMQMQQRMPPSMASDARMAQEVARVQAEQAYQQQLRQQRHAQPNSQAGSQPIQNPSLLSQSNPTMLASLQGRSSPSVNGVTNPSSSSTSPRMTQPQTLSGGMTPAVNQINAQYKARHPQASPEQISRMTTETLLKMSNDNARQLAIQSAAGNANTNAVTSNSGMGIHPTPIQQASMLVNGTGPIPNAQQYAQFMRSQQASQQRGGGAGSQQNGSRSVTPLTQGGPPRPSQSPSARQVGLAGGQ